MVQVFKNRYNSIIHVPKCRLNDYNKYVYEIQKEHLRSEIMNCLEVRENRPTYQIIKRPGRKYVAIEHSRQTGRN